MDSLRVFAAKVKSSPQLIRKTFAASSEYDSYSKVLQGDKLKGRANNVRWRKTFSFAAEMCLSFWNSVNIYPESGVNLFLQYTCNDTLRQSLTRI